MAKGWEKRNCYVVHAWYRDELYQESETPMKEEDVVLSFAEAEHLKVEYESNPDFEEVYIEEEEREFWVDIEEKNVVSDEEKILEMAAKIEQNKEEDSKYVEQVKRYLDGKMPAYERFCLGSNPNVLKLLGSQAESVVLNQSDVKNALADNANRTSKHSEGHEIPSENLYQLSKEIRNPIMILNGSKNTQSIVMLTELKNKENLNIVLSIALDRQNGKVNKITSLYGKNNVSNYVSIHQKDIVALNIEKTEKLYRDIGYQLPKLDTVFCFDNSIAYTTENVTKIYEKYLEMFRNENKIEDTVQEPDVKSPGITSETNSANAVSANKIVGKEKNTVNDRICKDLMKNEFQPTSSLVNHMKKLHHLTGQELSIKDVSNMYSGIKNPEIQNVVKSIAKECGEQEKSRKVQGPAEE